MKRFRLPYGIAALALIVAFAGCGGDDDDDDASGNEEPTGVAAIQEIGEGEGSISILSWAGYAEDGSTDPAYDWVTPFEQETGCKAKLKTFGTSDEAFQLFQTGEYDVVSASGDSALRSVANGDAAALNTDLFTNYDDIWENLKEKPWNSVDGKVYGLPHAWGANQLMYNEDVVKPAPTSWGVVFDENSPYKGKLTAYDSPIYIADAALYLKATQPDLKIENPYALDEEQFNAAVDLLKQQKDILGEYWSDLLKEQEAFTNGSIVAGTAWQYTTNLILDDDAAPPVKAFVPDEGATAWSDNWQVYSKTKVPNCAYLWLNYITSAKVQAEATEYYGEAPANLKACDLASPGFCDGYHAEDQEYYDQLSYWTTPTTECLDGRTDVDCKAYKDWSAAWDEIKGS